MDFSAVFVFSGDTAKEAQRWDMGQRIREVEQGPNGAIWILEDDCGGAWRQASQAHTRE